MTIHKEGRTSVLVLLLLNLVGSPLAFQYLPAGAAYTFAIIAFLLLVIIGQFFRYPTKNYTKGANLVIAPADGKVVVVEKTFEKEYLKDERIQVSIFMSPINVHSNHNPVSGVVSFFKYHPGKFLVAWHPKSSEENERTTVVTKMANGTEVLFRQIAGALARRICWYVKEGDQVEQCEQFGFIKFGSRVDIFLPLTAEITVKPGDITTGAETIIAKLND